MFSFFSIDHSDCTFCQSCHLELFVLDLALLSVWAHARLTEITLFCCKERTPLFFSCNFCWKPSRSLRAESRFGAKAFNKSGNIKLKVKWVWVGIIKTRNSIWRFLWRFLWNSKVHDLTWARFYRNRLAWRIISW